MRKSSLNERKLAVTLGTFSKSPSQCHIEIATCSFTHTKWQSSSTAQVRRGQVKSSNVWRALRESGYRKKLSENTSSSQVHTHTHTRRHFSCLCFFAIYLCLDSLMLPIAKLEKSNKNIKLLKQLSPPELLPLQVLTSWQDLEIMKHWVSVMEKNTYRLSLDHRF